MSQQIDGTRFGAIEVDPDKIIEFPRGIPGFEDLTRFALLHPEGDPGNPPKYFILQSLDDPAIAFHIADPQPFGFDGDLALSDEESQLLGLTDPADAAVVVMLLNEGGGGVRANLTAPLVLNLKARRGLQYIIGRPDAA